MTTIAGRYLLGGPLGYGGTATVWRATDTVTGASVALKLLRGDADAVAAEDWLDQASRTIGLDHPGIVPVLAAGMDGGQAWVATELVDGVTLAAHLARVDRVSPRAALTCVAALLDALAHTHRAGVLHLDISAANIMLPAVGAASATRGCPRVDLAAPRLVDLATTPVTPDGRVRVSPHYASPEVAVAGHIDARADLYSVGAVLVHLIAGRPPVDGADLAAVLAAQVNEPTVPLSRLVLGVDSSVEALVDRAMAKDPDDRFVSATSMLARVLDVLDTLGPDGDEVLATAVGEVTSTPLARTPVLRAVPVRRSLAPVVPLDVTRLQAAAVATASTAGSAVGPSRGATPDLAVPRQGAGIGAGVVVGGVLAALVVGVGIAGAAASTSGTTTPTGRPAVTVTSRQPTPSPSSVRAAAVAGPTSMPSIAADEPLAEVPQLVGYDVDTAQRLLTAAGLELGSVTEQPAALARGQVVAQDPEAGSTLAPGAPISVVISAGPAPTPTPTGDQARPTSSPSSPPTGGPSPTVGPTALPTTPSGQLPSPSVAPSPGLDEDSATS